MNETCLDRDSLTSLVQIKKSFGSLIMGIYLSGALTAVYIVCPFADHLCFIAVKVSVPSVLSVPSCFSETRPVCGQRQ